MQDGMVIIGLGHKSRSGKDTAAEILRGKLALRSYDVKVVPFARKLKAVSKDLYGMYGLEDEIFYNQRHNEHLRDVKLACGKTPVEIWIALGDTLKKATIESVWRDYVLKNTKCEVLIIPDVRYVEEAEAIHELGGRVYRIDRASAVTKGSDSYLSNYRGWDGVVDNNSTLEHLGNQLDTILEAALG